MAPHSLTRRQQEIYEYLQEHLPQLSHPPTLDEVCDALGLKSRGSLHKQIQALITAGLIEPMNNLRRGIRLTEAANEDAAVVTEMATDEQELPMYGLIAAGQPIQAIANPDTISVPPSLRTANPCYVLEVKGDSMIEEGILEGDMVIIEQCDQARNGAIVVALVDDDEATLKRLEKKADEIILHPANSSMRPMHFHPSQIKIQGILVGQMRSYH